MDIALLINGQKPTEDIAIKITTPEYIVMNDRAELYKDINEQVIRSRSDNREEIEAVLQRMRAIREDLNIHIQVKSISNDKETDLSKFLISVGGVEVKGDGVVFGKVE